MPRYHNINGERIQFTAAEETARDLEERAGTREQEKKITAGSARSVLLERINSDTATLKDVLAFLRSGSI